MPASVPTRSAPSSSTMRLRRAGAAAGVPGFADMLSSRFSRIVCNVPRNVKRAARPASTRCPARPVPEQHQLQLRPALDPGAGRMSAGASSSASIARAVELSTTCLSWKARCRSAQRPVGRAPARTIARLLRGRPRRPCSRLVGSRGPSSAGWTTSCEMAYWLLSDSLSSDQRHFPTHDSAPLVGLPCARVAMNRGARKLGAQAHKAVGKDAAFEKGVELVFDKVGSARAALSLDLCQEGLEMFLDHLIQRRFFRSPSFVVAMTCVLLCTACAGIGARAVTADRFDYTTALSHSWKSQMLINVVKVRYGDAPIFLDVSSVIESYELTQSASAGYAWQFRPTTDSGATVGVTGGTPIARRSPTARCWEKNLLRASCLRSRLQGG